MFTATESNKEQQRLSNNVATFQQQRFPQKQQVGNNKQQPNNMKQQPLLVVAKSHNYKD